MRLRSIVLMLALTLGSLAQSDPATLLVTFHHTNEPLGNILEEAQRRYHLQFFTTISFH